ncbi:hypothetical protein QV08_10325 [Gallibacterium salpingitidis]|uniref:Glutathione synthetase n=1 Tax=Gallibacterium salpingitidis TaxID=505341 RepID=A0AB36E0W6_9PAST|nr:SemiSWEET transporter [Gallibacterium salpingitidis]OBX06516.1 hypothetical protein QV08_10325 [Gallibacterium salpingitidis]OBX08857.1 hypothetical protein QV09_08980 [Gallibacterium salpingitidis]WKS99461.1 SemiSWEET transporter [Gallibacterium salpingitidis]
MYDFIGIIAAFLTTTAFIPQVIKVLKTKETNAISSGMYAMQVTGLALWLIYGLCIQNIPVILANMVSLVLSFTILFCKIKFTPKMTPLIKE